MKKAAGFILVALLIAALALNTWWVDTTTRQAVARDGGRLIETAAVTANVKVEGEGPVIVMIHGFGAAIDWWDEIAPDLAKDHRVIRIDLIGHGGTAAPRSGYTIERQASMVSDVLDKLGANRITVIGHSMGGEVATALTEIDPKRIERLIYIDSPPTAGTTFTILTDAYMQPVLGEFLSRLVTDRSIRKGLAQGFAPGFPIRSKFVSDLEQLTYQAFRSAHEDSIRYRTRKPPYERLAAVTPVPPLLAIFGSRDAIVPPDHANFFLRVPGAKTATIEGAGHSPMVEQPAKTLDLIRGFLKQ